MVRLSAAALFIFAVSAYALGDPAGANNVGNSHGAQFIGGECLSSADCASGCCAFISGGGLCSGLGAQFQAGKSGCGFGDVGKSPSNGSDQGSGASSGSSTSNAAAAPAGFDASVGDVNGAKNLGNGKGAQFITGACLSNADCGSGCCAGLRGGAVCSGPGASFQNGKQGCGFSSSGAQSSGSGSSTSNSGGSGSAAAPATSAPAGFDASVGDVNGAKNLGNGKGAQFITGACLSNADCGSGCCAGLRGGAVCSGPGASFQNGKQGCGFQSGKRSVSVPFKA